MRLIFMGTPDFSVPALDALVAAGHEIACVYTQPPRPGGRGQRPRPSPVQARAEGLGLVARSPASLRDPAEQAAFAALGAEAAVVVAYGLILPKAVLAAPARGCLNIHASLLPRWRGAAPIQRAVMAGDARTGVSIMAMEAGLDTGPVLLDAAVEIGPEDTAGRPARPAGGAGGAADRRGAGPDRRADGGAAAGGGRHLCREDRQGRGEDRLEPAGGGGRSPDPRAVAVPGRVDGDRRGSG